MTAVTRFAVLAGFALSAPAILYLTSPAAAGSFGCNAHRISCYDHANPASRAEMEARTIVTPARTDVVHEPAVVMNRPQRIETTPGYVTPYFVPARYGTVTRDILVRPSRVQYTTLPAQFKTVREWVRVRDGGWKWQRQRDRFGRETRCKVYVHPVSKSLTRTIMIAPERRVAHITPAVYRTEQRHLRLAPAHIGHHYSAANYAYIDRPVVVRPAQTHLLTHPAATRLIHDRERSSHWR